MTQHLTMLSPERVLMSPTTAKQIDRFTGFDEGVRSKPHRIRRSSSPEFMITIVNEEDGDPIDEDYMATIVAVNVPADRSTDVPAGAPIAVAEVVIDDEAWFLIISRGIGLDTSLHISQVLVQHEGEPEELFARPDLFEPADE